jgi:hypothetical protein
MTYTNRSYIFNISPPWLRRFVGRRFMGGAVGLTFDLLAEGSAQALKAPWLREKSSPADALPPIGDERRMPRYPADTDDTYRARLADAWEAWDYAGAGTAIARQFNDAGFQNVRVIEASNNDERPSRPSWRFEEPHAVRELVNVELFSAGISGDSEIQRLDGQNWSDLGYQGSWAITLRGSASNDGRTFTIKPTIGDRVVLYATSESANPLVSEGPATLEVLGCYWSRFVVVVEQPHPWTPWLCGNGFVVATGDDAKTVGSTALFGDVRTARQIARQWKSGHSVNPYILLVLSGIYCGDPDLICGAGFVVGGETIKWQHQG